MAGSSTAALRAAPLALALSLALTASAAQAHITIDPPSANAGAYQKLTFRVGHGCVGSATTGITVQIPDGIHGAKPMPKPGWTLSTVEGPLAAPVQVHGKPVASAVREISWRGGPLPDAWYDEFVMQVRLPDTPGRYAFKVGQACEKGRMDWVELPAPGAHADAPAPVLEVLAPEANMPGMPATAHHH